MGINNLEVIVGLLGAMVMPGQQPVIDALKELDYQSNQEGVCFGTAYMALRAFLAGDLLTFNNRMQVIYNLKPGELKKMVEEEKKERLNFIEKTKRIVLEEIEQKRKKQGKEIKKIDGLEPDEKEYFSSKVSQILLKNEEREEKKINSFNIRAFLEGVEACFRPDNYPEILPKQQALSQFTAILPMLSVMLPDTLQKAGIKQGEIITGIYDQRALTDWFNYLNKTLEGCNYPVAFTLHNINHTIAIGYNPKEKSWVFIDPNQLPLKPDMLNIKNPAELASRVIRAFSPSSPTSQYAAFSSIAYVGGNHYKDLQNRPFTPKYQEQQLKNKINQMDSYGVTWFMIAALYGDTQNSKILLTEEKNINRKESSFGMTALICSALQENVELTKLILEKKSDVSIQDTFGHTALHYVARRNLDLTGLLLARKADPNIQDGNGQSSLHEAVLAKQSEIATLLLASHANPELQTNLKRTALKIAVENEDRNSIKILLAHGADPSGIKSSNPNIIADLLLYGPSQKTVTLFAEYFKANLNKMDPLILRSFLEQLSPEAVTQLLNAIEADYILLTPHNPFHRALKALMDNSSGKNDKLSQLFDARIKFVLNKKQAFLGNKVEDKKESKLSERKAITNEILYSKLVERADQASTDDQWIYQIYLRHYFPQVDYPSGELPSKMFKEAHENSLVGISKEVKELLSIVKDGNVEAIKKMNISMNFYMSLLKPSNQCCDNNQTSLLFWAVRCDQQPMLDYFYRYDDGREGALMCRQSKEELSEVLYRDRLKSEYLLSIATCTSIEATQFLIERKATHVDPYYLASSSQLGVLQYIVDQGIKIDRYQEYSLLHCLSQFGNVEMVKYVVERKADINELNKQQVTPLDLALISGNMTIAKYLKEQNAKSSKFYFSNRNLNLPALQTLKKDFNINVINPDQFGNNPLVLAVSLGQFDVVKFLLKQGANPLLEDKGKKIYDYATDPLIKKLLLSAELKEVIKKYKVSPDEEKKEASLVSLVKGIFVDTVARKKEIHLAAKILKKALDQSVSVQELENLKSWHPYLEKPPLDKYFEKVKASLSGLGFEFKKDFKPSS